MMNGLFSAIQPKQVDSIEGFGPRQDQNLPTTRGMIGPPSPMFDPGIPTTRGALEQNVRDIQKSYDKYQEIFDKLVSAVEKRAAIAPVLPAPMQISGKEAQTVGMIQAIARALGARDQYVQGAGQNYLGTREQMMAQDNARALQQSNLDYTNQMNQANAGVTGLEMGLDQQLNRIKGLEGINKNLSGILETEITQEGLNARNEANILGRVTLEELKQLGRKRLAEFTDDAAERGRLVEFFAKWEMVGGADEKTAYYRAYEKVSSAENLDVLRAQGQYLKNMFDKEANPLKLTGLGLDNAQTEAETARVKASTAKTIADTEYVKRRTSLLGQELSLKIQAHELNRDKFLNDLAGKSTKELADKEKELRGIRTDLSKRAEDYRKEMRALQTKLAQIQDSEDGGEAQSAEIQKQIQELMQKISDVQQEYKKTTADLEAVKMKPAQSSNDPVNPFNIDPSLKGRIGR